MREVRRSALLPYAVQQVYGLVADVERYPEFLPWCTDARILAIEGVERTETSLVMGEVIGYRVTPLMELARRDS